MKQADDFDRGLKNRRAVLGEEWVERSLANATSFNADFQSLITRYAWHDIWGRPGLDRTTRRLLVLGMTMGLARWEEFELHCRAAVRASKQGDGVTLEQIKETLDARRDLLRCAGGQHRVQDHARHPARRRPRNNDAAAHRALARVEPPHLQRAAAARQGAGRVRGHAGHAQSCARPGHADVGSPCCRAGGRAPGAALRPSRPWRLGGAARPVHDGRARRRRGAPHPRVGPRAGRIRRPVDGRHGRAGAGGALSRAAARSGAREHDVEVSRRGAAQLDAAHRDRRSPRHAGHRRDGARALLPPGLSRRPGCRRGARIEARCCAATRKAMSRVAMPRRASIGSID